MRSEDVPNALALIKKWSSQFEIRQVFNSEEQFAHHFLFQRQMFTYIVENKTNNITDLVSFVLFNIPQPGPVANVTAVISTQSPVKQLIIDTLVCATKNGAKEVTICQCSIESDILASLSFQPSGYDRCHFYNYRYHEISQTKFWVSHF